jgi:hypothetical protein
VFGAKGQGDGKEDEGSEKRGAAVKEDWREGDVEW